MIQQLSQSTAQPETSFELCDTLYATATLEPNQDQVYIWLGASKPS